MTEPTHSIERSGTQRWRFPDGRHHREGGPAIIHQDGSTEWYQNGKIHREDGPAVEWADGTKKWFLNGKLHREDGPAIEWADGDVEWYLEGVRIKEASAWVQKGPKLIKLLKLKAIYEMMNG
jgi:hypothetical protein